MAWKRALFMAAAFAFCGISFAASLGRISVPDAIPGAAAVARPAAILVPVRWLAGFTEPMNWMAGVFVPMRFLAGVIEPM